MAAEAQPLGGGALAAGDEVLGEAHRAEADQNKGIAAEEGCEGQQQGDGDPHIARVLGLLGEAQPAEQDDQREDGCRGAQLEALVLLLLAGSCCLQFKTPDALAKPTAQPY